MNSYLKLRSQKIARNEARLAELGLLVKRKPESTSASASVSDSKANSAQSRSRSPKRNIVTPTIPLRRSTRITGRPETYTEPILVELRSNNKRQRQHMPHIVATSIDSDDACDEIVPPVAVSYPPSSVRTMDIHVEHLVLGNNKNGSQPDLCGVLATLMEQTGKAFVMEETFRRCCGPSNGKPSHVPKLSFNKYSGVQEWKNDAMFLWVNLGGPGAVVNDFLQEGRQITWFGGSRMHDESNVIRRLLRVSKRAARGELPADCGIVLWVRMHCNEKRGFGPYMCLGRLAYHSHEPGSRPLKFLFNLVDYDQLRESHNSKMGDLVRIMQSS